MRDYLALLTRWQEGQAREDRRTQQVTWMLLNVNWDHQRQPMPYKPEDFPIHQWSLLDKDAAPAQTPEEVAWSEIQTLQSGIEAFFGPSAGTIQNGTTKPE